MSAGTEKRRAARHQALNQACVRAGQTRIYCAIRDISSTGAKLEIGSDSPFPRIFEISLGQPGITLMAKAAWRTADRVGIAFRRPLDESELEAIKTRMTLQPRGRYSRSSRPLP